MFYLTKLSIRFLSTGCGNMLDLKNPSAPRRIWPGLTQWVAYIPQYYVQLTKVPSGLCDDLLSNGNPFKTDELEVPTPVDWHSFNEFYERNIVKHVSHIQKNATKPVAPDYLNVVR